MKPAPGTLAPRAKELLAERAQRPLDDNEHWELDQLGAGDDDSFDLAAAGIAIAHTPIEAMPEELAMRILAASPANESSSAFDAMKTIPGTSLMPGNMRTLAGVAPQSLRMQAQPAPQPEQMQQPIAPLPGPPVTDIERAREKKRSKVAIVMPWLAAAACLALAIGAFLWARQQKPDEPKQVATLSITEQREQLISRAKDISKIEWTPTADPNAKGAKGDVVWSQAEQKGYMRFVGLAPNDATQFQYQLWIFDKDRDAAFPVDGGVFDVGANGEVIVPISAKLNVNNATLFAVTIEKPGGVVVSKRERIVVTAERKS